MAYNRLYALGPNAYNGEAFSQTCSETQKNVTALASVKKPLFESRLQLYPKD